MRHSSITSLRFIVLHKFGTTGRVSVSEPDVTFCSLSGVCSIDSLGELDAIDIVDETDKFDVCTCFCVVSFVGCVDIFNCVGEVDRIDEVGGGEVDRIDGVGDRVRVGRVDVNLVGRFDDVVAVDKADACP